MQASDIPAWFAKRFGVDAAGSYIRTVPQTTADPAAASFSLGFPPQTFTDEGAGGTPPDGRDVNGILNILSAWSQWFSSGGAVPYNSTFQTDVGGYPLGAIVASAVTAGLLWQSTTENNVTNPDAAGAGWRALAVRAATLAELQAATSTLVVPTAKGLKDAGYDRVVAQSLVDNNGYRIYESGFKEAWGFQNVLGAGASATVTFASFMPPGQAFSSFHRVTLGSSIAPAGTVSPVVGLTSTDLSQFTVRNGSTAAASYQWSTSGV